VIEPRANDEHRHDSANDHHGDFPLHAIRYAILRKALPRRNRLRFYASRRRFG
jgi:hypothetical protein